MKIVLHSCYTGSQSKGKPGFAQKLTSEISDVIIVAPNSEVYTKNGKEIGVYTDRTLQTESRWVQFERGEQTKTYKGSSLPGSKGFNYLSNQSFFSMLSNLFK